jgi:predicted phosphodiesterase
MRLTDTRKGLFNIACVAGVFVMFFTSGCAMKRAKFVFGVIADVQYADRQTPEEGDLSKAIEKLAYCVARFNSKNIVDNASYVGKSRKPSFVIQLGDMIAGGDNASKEFDQILGIYNRIHTDRYHVLGNHDFTGISRKRVLRKLEMEKPYYDFRYGKWRFVVLDTMDVSVQGGWGKESPNYIAGEKMLSELAGRQAPNAIDWNGGVGAEQKEWLSKILSDADRKKQNVVVFGHHPLVPEGNRHNLWNNDEIINVLESHKSVFAYINGHRHVGDYAWQNNIYYVTIDGMITSPKKKGFAVVWVYADRLEIEGMIENPRLTLPLVKR